jgi:hypothetical protein
VILEKLLRALLIHLRDRDEVGSRLALRRVWHRAGQSQLVVEGLRGGEEMLSRRSHMEVGGVGGEGKVVDECMCMESN